MKSAAKEQSHDPAPPAATDHTDLLAFSRLEAALAAIATHLDAQGLQALVIKGWAAAQFYPHPESRTIGDIDLCAAPGQFDAVLEALGTLCPGAPPGRRSPIDGTAGFLIEAGPHRLPVVIDLHPDLAKYQLPLDHVFAQARRTAIAGGQSIWTPSPEHHLRIAAMHFLLDGGVRRRPLEDIAAILGAGQTGLDWEAVLGPDQRSRRWIACAIRFAAQLIEPGLEAHLPDLVRQTTIPTWFANTAMHAFREPASAHHARQSFGQTLRTEPARFWEEIRARWPNPIKASVELGWAFSQAPRLLVQTLAFLRRTMRFAARPPTQ